ncbi:YceI family protein [Pseudoduganella chitinolytica]|uniref:YceI family protein n=1 Tax=Pseudoduganella chitinolytica TaxID=34070 RepID=A0ABY8BG96_9BURK|nr:YceI family protein [Pseudoduganella chitinolytica]WEF34003.1 YceI family protein [Pseudoduganella chitinolytica]
MRYTGAMPISLSNRKRALLGAAGAVLALAACRAPSPVSDPASEPASGAAAGPTSALPASPIAGAPVPPPVTGVLSVDSAASLIAITVRRGGPLARLGHDHVVAARTVVGTVDPAGNRAALRFRLDELTVDEPALRAQAGLDTILSAEAIAGTRHNMLTRVLDAERYPWVDVAIERTGPQTVQAAITLHGVTRRYDVPVAVTSAADGVVASGTLAMRQTDFGLVPFAVLGGAMAVQDELALRFAIVAR